GLCVWAAALWMARIHRRERATVVWVAAGTGAILVTAWWIGTPIWSAHHHDARLVDAFREHFAWNWTRWTGAPDYYLAVWRREFGAADGVVAAIRTNPAAVARHVGDNLRGIVRTLVGTPFDHYPLLAPPTWPVAVRLETL